jgi:hypothetical protein
VLQDVPQALEDALFSFDGSLHLERYYCFGFDAIVTSRFKTASTHEVDLSVQQCRQLCFDTLEFEDIDARLWIEVDQHVNIRRLRRLMTSNCAENRCVPDAACPQLDLKLAEHA